MTLTCVLFFLVLIFESGNRRSHEKQKRNRMEKHDKKKILYLKWGEKKNKKIINGLRTFNLVLSNTGTNPIDE